MLAINNQDKFNAVVETALAKAANFPRWQKAIQRAIEEIESNPLIHWVEEDKSLLICSPSNSIYSANGICQCKAFVEFNQPCWHRAAARIARLYMESEANQTTPLAPRPDVIREDERAIYICGGIRPEEAKVGGFRL